MVWVSLALLGFKVIRLFGCPKSLAVGVSERVVDLEDWGLLQVFVRSQKVQCP